jgi:2-polyprenyl-3-methyl-5-hydroxy-6-metoxy-1,4-benzoquinol methylase
MKRAFRRRVASAAWLQTMASSPNIHRCCPICEDEHAAPHWSKPPLRVVRCGKCSMLYADPVSEEFVTGRFYGASNYHLSPEKLQSDFAPVRFDREMKLFRRFCTSGSILDVGCSTGAFLHSLKARFGAAYDVTGMDVPGPALDYARTHGIPVIETPFLECDFGERSFDAITFWAVLEHVDRPRQFLSKAAVVLRSGGYCFILVPNARSLAIRLLGRRYRYIMPEHLNYFSRETLLRFAQTEPRLQIREICTMHFNPVVIWQDWRRGSELVPEEKRARLLKKTTAMKESPLLGPIKFMYRTVEQLLGVAGLADNLVVVLQRV